MKSGAVLTTISALSDPGLVRTNNEDSFLLADLSKGKSLPDSCQINRPMSHNLILMVVSDGVGGSQLGELASEITVLTMKDAFVKLSKDIPACDRLVAAVEQANHLLFTENAKNMQSHGMKATVTVAVIEHDVAYIASVGDSRAYLIRNGLIKQLTTDQTIAGVLVSKGLINPEEAAKQPRSNVILQAIGNAAAIQVAVTSIALEHGDHMLLCSDGLSGKISDQELLMLSTAYPTLDIACSQMVDLAKERGGEDNITVALAKFESKELPSKRAKRLTHEVKQLLTFDPYNETQKSQKRTGFFGNEKDREVGTKIGIEVRGIHTEQGNFTETSETLQLGKMDVSFILTREVKVDDLLHIALEMPRDLRMFDYDETVYKLYVQVRKVSKQEGGFLVRVAFISKEHPDKKR